jgi:hypothetical protein
MSVQVIEIRYFRQLLQYAKELVLIDYDRTITKYRSGDRLHEHQEFPLSEEQVDNELRDHDTRDVLQLLHNSGMKTMVVTARSPVMDYILNVRSPLGWKRLDIQSRSEWVLHQNDLLGSFSPDELIQQAHMKAYAMRQRSGCHFNAIYTGQGHDPNHENGVALSHNGVMIDGYAFICHQPKGEFVCHLLTTYFPQVKNVVMIDDDPRVIASFQTPKVAEYMKTNNVQLTVLYYPHPHAQKSR